MGDATDESPFPQQAGAVFALLRDLESMQKTLSTKIDQQHGLLESLLNTWQKDCPPKPLTTTPVMTPVAARQALPADLCSHLGTATLEGYASYASDTHAYISGLETCHSHVDADNRHYVCSKESTALFDDDAELRVRRHAIPTKATDGTMFRHDSGCVMRLLHEQVWPCFCTVVIVLNAACIGWETQLKVNISLGFQETLAPVSQEFFDILETIFLLSMICEVFVNIMLQRWDFIFGEDNGWNAFDVVLILLSIGLWMLNYGSLSLLRVARLFHLGRLLRAFRVCKFLRSIRSVLISLLHSVRHLIAAVIVMGICMYTTALIMMHEMLRRFPDSQDVAMDPSRMLSTGFRLPKDSDTAIEQVVQLYGSIGRTMMTLFMSISGGMEWAAAAEPLAELGTIFGIVWTAYIALMVFCVLNVLVGIFVNFALQAMEDDRDNKFHAQIEELNTLIPMIKAVFKTSDTDGSGTLSLVEFECLMENNQCITHLKAMGIDANEASGLFKYLDEDGSGAVSVDEFVSGLLRLKGVAKAADMVTLLDESRKMSRKLNKLFRETKSLTGVVGVLQYLVSNPPPAVSHAARPSAPGDTIAQSDLGRAPSDLQSESSRSTFDGNVHDDAWLRPWRPGSNWGGSIKVPWRVGTDLKDGSSASKAGTELEDEEAREQKQK